MENKYNYDNITADTYIKEKSREVIKNSIDFIRKLVCIGCFLLLMAALFSISIPLGRLCDKNVFRNYFRDNYTYTIGDTVKVSGIDESVTVIAYCYYGEKLDYVDDIITKPYDYVGVKETDINGESQELIYFVEDDVTQILVEEDVN